MLGQIILICCLDESVSPVQQCKASLVSYVNRAFISGLGSPVCPLNSRVLEPFRDHLAINPDSGSGAAPPASTLNWWEMGVISGRMKGVGHVDVDSKWRGQGIGWSYTA